MKKHIYLSLVCIAMASLTFTACKKSEIVTEEVSQDKSKPKKSNPYEYNFFPLVDQGNGQYTFAANGVNWMMNDLRDELDWTEGKMAQGTLIGSTDGSGVPTSGTNSFAVVGYVNTWGGGASPSQVNAWNDALTKWQESNGTSGYPVATDYLTGPANGQWVFKGVLIRSENSESTYAVVSGRYPVKP